MGTTQKGFMTFFVQCVNRWPSRQTNQTRLTLKKTLRPKESQTINYETLKLVPQCNPANRTARTIGQKPASVILSNKKKKWIAHFDLQEIEIYNANGTSTPTLRDTIWEYLRCWWTRRKVCDLSDCRMKQKLEILQKMRHDGTYLMVYWRDSMTESRNCRTVSNVFWFFRPPEEKNKSVYYHVRSETVLSQLFGECERMRSLKVRQTSRGRKYKQCNVSISSQKSRLFWKN